MNPKITFLLLFSTSSFFFPICIDIGDHRSGNHHSRKASFTSQDEESQDEESQDGETNVFVRKSKSIIDTLAKHWTTTRGAEILSMAVVSTQLLKSSFTFLPYPNGREICLANYLGTWGKVICNDSAEGTAKSY